ncbi:hypothetical protein [Couchioplanes azureus]|nr:hypothetical protein [Couchioplanes caeruleus]
MFFTARPELRGRVVIHHAVEQQVLSRCADLVDQALSGVVYLPPAP